ncbi:LysR family transcriptional regulator [Mycolicibacterium mengxianglii]|uniref:LysR family transcriptional regulator n=1 Tax=Mycolicibacterium mengxianglii TaxID=2736649 RepID=UPI0018EF1C92|nr:LysR substrate-binding domain-containing protein [Mycolicibacterium mengxianglii]
MDLTAAGRVFKTEARNTLRSLDHAVRRAQQVGHGVLRIATPPGTGAGLLRELIRGYLTRFGSDTVELVFTREQTSAVRDGRADVALVCSAEDLTGLDAQNVAIEHPVALVATDHPFAARQTLTMTRLLRDPAYAAELPPVGLDALVDLVATGQLIAVVGDSATDRLGRHVAAVPVTGLAPIDVLLAWPADSHDPRVAALLDLIGPARRQSA